MFLGSLFFTSLLILVYILEIVFLYAVLNFKEDKPKAIIMPILISTLGSTIIFIVTYFDFKYQGLYLLLVFYIPGFIFAREEGITKLYSSLISFLILGYLFVEHASLFNAEILETLYEMLYILKENKILYLSLSAH